MTELAVDELGPVARAVQGRRGGSKRGVVRKRMRAQVAYRATLPRPLTLDGPPRRRAKMTVMLRPATPADRPDLVALALAEDAAWSGASAVSAEEAGEFVDSFGLGMVFVRDGRVAAYAATGEGDETILLVDPGDDPAPALEALVAWLGEQGRHRVDSYARDARRIAWLEASGFAHRRSFFDLDAAPNRRCRARSGPAGSPSRATGPARMTPPCTS